MESYYSSDEEIAWGPVTLREIKGDLKRPVVRKPKRRHTVFGTFQKEPEQIEITSELHTENMPHLHEEVAGKLNISGVSTAYYTPNDSLRTERNVDFLEKLSKVINDPQSDVSLYASALDNTKSSVSTNNISSLLDGETGSADYRSAFTNTDQEKVPYNFKKSTENIDQNTDQRLQTPYLSINGNKNNLNDTCYNFVNAVAQRHTQYDIANFHQTLVDNSLVVSEDEQRLDENQYSDNDHSINEVNVQNKRTSTIQEEEEEEEEEEVIVIISDDDDEESLLIMDDSLDEVCTKSFKKERESESLISSRAHLSYSFISTDSETDEPNDNEEDNLRNNISSEQNPYNYVHLSDEDNQVGVSKVNYDNIDDYVEEERLILEEENEIRPISRERVSPERTEKLFSLPETPHRDDCLTNKYLLIDGKEYTENLRVLTPIENKLSISSSPIEVPEFDLAQFDSNDDSLKLDDTMEAINRLLQQGPNSAISDKKEVIESTPTKSNPNTKAKTGSFSQKLQPVNLPSNKKQVTNIPLRNVHPTSAEKTQFNRHKQNLPSPSQFRVPEVPHKPKLTLPTPPKSYCHSNLQNVVSPVALYIRNSPRVALKKNIPQKELSHIVKTNTPKVSRKENHCDFPQVVYKPSKRQITTKEKEIILPPSLKKLNVKEPVITKHEGRIRQNLEKVLVNRNLLENDITNNSIDVSMLNSSSDTSVLTKKQAYIK